MSLSQASGVLEKLERVSLVRCIKGRYRLLEPIRGYLQVPAGTADRLADYFLTWCETGQAPDALETERVNLDATWECLENRGEAESLLRLGGALWRFWPQRGTI